MLPHLLNVFDISITKNDTLINNMTKLTGLLAIE